MKIRHISIGIVLGTMAGVGAYALGAAFVLGICLAVVAVILAPTE